MKRLIDLWVGRRAETSSEGLRMIEALRPVTVVTGGSRGIGFALARRFAKAGHDVAIIARDRDALQLAADAIRREQKVEAIAIVMDVASADGMPRIATEVRARGFYVDVLVNCAGIGLSGPFNDHTPEEIDRLIDVNVTALTRLTREALPGMLERGRGGVINVASLGGLIPGPNQAAYYASKAYVVSLTRAIATEISGRGVRMMALAPGPVDTGFHQAMGAELSFYRQILLALSARQVAFEGFIAYQLGFRLYVPGVTGKLLQVAVWIIPHALLLPITGWLLRRRREPSWAGADEASRD